MKHAPARLIIADSEGSADMLYATRFFAPDAFLLLVQDGRSTILLSDLEVDRGRKTATVDEVVSMSEFIKEHKKALGKHPSYAKTAAHFLRTRKVRRALVPGEFPLGLTHEIHRAGIKLATPKGGRAFWPDREIKTRKEIDAIRAALTITAAGLARGIEVLAASEILPDGALTWGGGALTSERLRTEIDSAILRAGGTPKDTIVAGGEQACDPHERGSGPLRGHELIILDVFPRDARTGYFGDMTRTVVRGTASEAQRALWTTVQDGQRLAIEATKPGADGKKIHGEITKLFKDRGFPTEKRDGRHVGFFHGTGHGLGLALHEDPRFQWTREMLPGQVFTVEPGLYYPGLGGVRIEDVVAVKKGGAEILTNFEQRLEV